MRVETEFFLQNSVSFSHNSVACAVRTLQFVLFNQALRKSTVICTDEITLKSRGNYHEK